MGECEHPRLQGQPASGRAAAHGSLLSLCVRACVCLQVVALFAARSAMLTVEPKKAHLPALLCFGCCVVDLFFFSFHFPLLSLWVQTWQYDNEEPEKLLQTEDDSQNRLFCPLGTTITNPIKNATPVLIVDFDTVCPCSCSCSSWIFFFWEAFYCVGLSSFACASFAGSSLCNLFSPCLSLSLSPLSFCTAFLTPQPPPLLCSTHTT